MKSLYQKQNYLNFSCFLMFLLFWGHLSTAAESLGMFADPVRISSPPHP